jgi:hypothetical protein
MFNDTAQPVDTWYSVYGLNSQLDAVMLQLRPGWYWLHYGDYASFKEAVIASKHLYTYRVIKCDLYLQDGVFYGIKGTHI